MSRHVDPERAQFDAFKGLDRDLQIDMLNLVRLRDELAARHPAVREVSAGMTDDFEEAIRAGATTIRVGRAIFGPRN